MPDPDERRSQRLRAMKLRANGLLVFAALTFVASHVLGSDDGIWGFVRAASEAGMVGGVADWFAVTALFRHPLGIPIPHTALIPRGKESIGRGLGEFIERSFLDTEAIVARIREAHPARRLAEWIETGDHAAQAAKQAAVILSGVTEALADEDIQAGISVALTERLRDTDLTPAAGAIVDWAVAGNHHQALVTAALRGVSVTLADSEQLLRDRLGAESPWWVPGNVDDAVFQRLNDGVQSFLAELIDQPDHELRRQIDDRAVQLASDMRTSAVVRARGEELRDQLLDDPATQEWIAALWSSIKATINEAAETPDSELRIRLEDAIVSIGSRLRTDEHLAARVETWVTTITQQLLDQSGGEVATLVASTVDRWDAEETSERIELLVGRDLQFIRINGTLVGALVGVAIHTLVVAL